jgi:hypothetical protein
VLRFVVFGVGIGAAAIKTGGEAGIRTLDTAFGPYNGLANRRLQPLGHLTATGFLSIYNIAGYAIAAIPKTVPEIVPASNGDEDLENRQRFFSEPSISATHSAAGVCSPEVAMRSPLTAATGAAPKRPVTAGGRRRVQRSPEPLPPVAIVSGLMPLLDPNPTGLRSLPGMEEPGRKWVPMPPAEVARLGNAAARLMQSYAIGQPRRGARRAEQAFVHRAAVGRRRADGLDRDRPIEPRVVGAIDLAHPGFAELGDDLVRTEAAADHGATIIFG